MSSYPARTLQPMLASGGTRCPTVAISAPYQAMISTRGGPVYITVERSFRTISTPLLLLTDQVSATFRPPSWTALPLLERGQQQWTSPPFSRHAFAAPTFETCGLSRVDTNSVALVSLLPAASFHAILGIHSPRWFRALGRRKRRNGLFILQCRSTAISLLRSTFNAWPE